MNTNQTPAASASRHTPEPWGIGASLDIASRADGANQHDIAHCCRGEWSDKERESNAARIVDCVNALAGMEPGAVAALVAAAEQYLKLNTVGNRALLREALAALKGGAK